MRQSPCFAAAVALMASCGAGLAQKPIDAQPATIWYSDQFTVHSRAVGRDFLIQVARPVKPQAGKVPVIYLLDGTSLFGAVADMVIEYGNFGDTAPAYVVGIGYPDADLGRWLSLRNHDLLYVPIPDSTTVAKSSGDGSLFQQFLQEELRPLIASRYPVDDRRAILAGHSLWGLFASHVLLNGLGAFSGYIVCSPTIRREPQLLERASAFHAAEPLKVFIGVGSKEEDRAEGLHMPKYAEELAARLKNHDSGTDVNFTDFQGQTHGTVIVECLSHGLQFMLPAPSDAAGH